MAKQRGPVASTFTGRVGNVVGAKMKGGEYVTRSYQPSVKNPNTLRQRISRAKMAMASQLGAVLAQPVKVGYAAASASTKMFARNMFVRDLIPVEAGVFSIDGENVTLDITKIAVSRQAGISIRPAGSVTAGTGGAMQFVPTNAADVELLGGETLGVCVCLIGENNDVCFFRQGVASTGVTFTADEVTAAGTGKYFAFYKAIPEALNGVPSVTEPWMYPSRTSGSTQVFTQA